MSLLGIYQRPKNITEVRALFGLVEPVSLAFSKCPDMVHIRHVLSPKDKFDWTEAAAIELLLAKLKKFRKIYEGVWRFCE